MMIFELYASAYAPVSLQSSQPAGIDLSRSNPLTFGKPNPGAGSLALKTSQRIVIDIDTAHAIPANALLSDDAQPIMSDENSFILMES